jgi:hypothetical protein
MSSSPGCEVDEKPRAPRDIRPIDHLNAIEEALDSDVTDTQLG